MKMSGQITERLTKFVFFIMRLQFSYDVSDFQS